VKGLKQLRLFSSFGSLPTVFAGFAQLEYIYKHCNNASNTSTVHIEYASQDTVSDGKLLL
jgi:hypothetical protein